MQVHWLNLYWQSVIGILLKAQSIICERISTVQWLQTASSFIVMQPVSCMGCPRDTEDTLSHGPMSGAGLI